MRPGVCSEAHNDVYLSIGHSLHSLRTGFPVEELRKFVEDHFAAGTLHVFFTLVNLFIVL
jgi:hypothetical protein